ncbi:MAG: type II toxin-antitoxin system HicA family toxin [Prevotella sp.]|nr:type II toxin-antitoxin system HicA family toxin [Prevotella sp.]
MNKKDKLLQRFRTLPRDFTFDEMVALFRQYGFVLGHKGSTSGSRVEFFNEQDGNSYIMHRPHPSNVIKGYVMRQVYTYLEVNGYLKQKGE